MKSSRKQPKPSTSKYEPPAPGLRVLSLYDGVGTGLYALDKLGFNVAAYYASEVDDDAIMVSRHHYGDRIVQLGCVKSITEEVIDRIGPIDLLIGGSPCNDLSCVNPLRKGLFDPEGTGVLFFDYYRIKTYLDHARLKEKKPKYYWMFENVAGMELESKDHISEFLGRQPILFNSGSLSAQMRRRYFWTNLPEVTKIAKAEVAGPKLEDYLDKNMGRRANIDKVGTITTKKSCLQDGSSRDPVTEDGNLSDLYITEIEKLFGFPPHFTDVGNLSVTRRQKLIGRAWSVPVVMAILHQYKLI